ncbi:MAG: 2-dehydropantoate 2-reductase [Methanomicrobiaceae archaeon]|nr:2-dehydropantoate 2-reductase [Methanomicrobiaceae archaeon]
MQVAVLGAGAVGLSVAAKLSAVCTVHAVCRPRHVEAIASRGFEMTGIWGDGTYRFTCSESYLPKREFDYIIITSKSTDTRAVCEQFSDAIAGAEVVSLQNGIGNEEIIAEYTGRVIGGMIITGFEWQGDARVHVSVEAGPVKLGRFPRGSDDAVRALAELFACAGIRCEESGEIRGDLWGKTLYNCALNPLGAIMNVPYGELDDPAAWEIIADVVEEAFAVCREEGVPLAWETPVDYLAYLAEVQLPATARHHSSMLQDLALGRKTEIDFINGAVVARGQQHGIPTPANTMLARLIRFREALCTKERGVRTA